jgi:hypothetical protein
MCFLPKNGGIIATFSAFFAKKQQKLTFFVKNNSPIVILGLFKSLIIFKYNTKL